MAGQKRKRDTLEELPSKKFKCDALHYPCVHELGHGWKLEIRKLEESDSNCVPDLFDSIQDWKDFVFYHDNSVVGIIKDEYGVWRGGFVAYTYDKPCLVKVPLFATSLHYRRQGLGRLLLSYLRQQASTNASILVLAMDDEGPIDFWKSQGCTKVDEKIFESVLTQDEKDSLIPMKLTNPGPPLAELQIQFDQNKPVFKDMMKRYASTKEEIELLEKCQEQIKLGKMKPLMDMEDADLEKEEEGEDEDEDFNVDEEEEELDEEEFEEDFETVQLT